MMDPRLLWLPIFLGSRFVKVDEVQELADLVPVEMGWLLSDRPLVLYDILSLAPRIGFFLLAVPLVGCSDFVGQSLILRLQDFPLLRSVEGRLLLDHVEDLLHVAVRRLCLGLLVEHRIQEFVLVLEASVLDLLVDACAE